jgi:hypothetical protein
MNHVGEVKITVYEYLRLVPINVLLCWFLAEDIGVFSRLVPTQYLTELVLS